MNILIKDTPTLLFDRRKAYVRTADTYISGGVIVAVCEKPDGKSQADVKPLCTKPDGFIPERILGGSDMLLMPGLINAHTHAYMSLLRSIADDLPFEKWLFEGVMPREEALTPDDAFYGSMLACCEMLRTGTTCFLDMHMFPGQSCRAALVSGMRAVISRGLASDGKAGEDRRLNEAFGEIEKYSGDSSLSFMLAPHAVYTCTHDYILRIASLASENHLPIHVHLSESRGEVERCISEHGMTPVKYLASLGLFDGKTVAAHCVYTDGDDITFLAEKNVSVASCPASNMKLANGFAPIPKFLASGVNVALGTDGAASNNTLNMFGEMRLAALIHKGNDEDALAVSASDALYAATRGGAEALGINSGSVEAGKNADLILLDLNVPQLCPRNDLVSSLVYSANGSEVRTSIIGGQIVLENSVPVLFDENEIYSSCVKIMNRLG